MSDKVVILNNSGGNEDYMGHKSQFGCGRLGCVRRNTDYCLRLRMRVQGESIIIYRLLIQAGAMGAEANGNARDRQRIITLKPATSGGSP